MQPQDIQKCDHVLFGHHYLRSAKLVGEQLRYAVLWKGQWLAVATWSAAAFHLTARDQFIGWTEEQRRQRLPLVANNSRLYVLEDRHYPYVWVDACRNIKPLCRATTSKFPKRFLYRNGDPERLRALVFSQSPVAWRSPT